MCDMTLNIWDFFQILNKCDVTCKGFNIYFCRQSRKVHSQRCTEGRIRFGKRCRCRISRSSSSMACHSSCQDFFEKHRLVISLLYKHPHNVVANVVKISWHRVFIFRIQVVECVLFHPALSKYKERVTRWKKKASVTSQQSNVSGVRSTFERSTYLFRTWGGDQVRQPNRRTLEGVSMLLWLERLKRLLTRRLQKRPMKRRTVTWQQMSLLLKAQEAFAEVNGDSWKRFPRHRSPRMCSNQDFLFKKCQAIQAT